MADYVTFRNVTKKSISFFKLKETSMSIKDKDLMYQIFFKICSIKKRISYNEYYIIFADKLQNYSHFFFYSLIQNSQNFMIVKFSECWLCYFSKCYKKIYLVF